MQSFISFTQTFPIDRTDTTTLNNSYLAIKQGIMNNIRTAITGIGTGFTFRAETAPTASGTQTLQMYFNTPFAATPTENYVLNIEIVFTVAGTPFPVSGTIASRFVRGDTVTPNMNLHTLALPIAASAGTPTEVTFDLDSILIHTPDCFAVGILRGNSTITGLAGIFTNFAIFRYSRHADNAVLWGGINTATASQPLQFLAPALTSIGWAMQVQYGFLRTTTSTQRLLSMNIAHFNESNSLLAPIAASVSPNADMMLVTAPNPLIPLGTMVRIDNVDYYVFSSFLNKHALGRIAA